MYVDWLGWTLDASGVQMIVTQKLTSLAFNYYDGSAEETEKKASFPSATSSRKKIRFLPSSPAEATGISSGTRVTEAAQCG